MLQNMRLTFCFDLKTGTEKGKKILWLGYVGYVRDIARSWFHP